MQTVRACCRALAACAAAFFSLSFEAAAAEHVIYSTPQNLEAKFELDPSRSGIYLFLSWDDVTVPADAPITNAYYDISSRFRAAGSSEAWSDWKTGSDWVQIPFVGQWEDGRGKWEFLSNENDRSKDWEFRVRCKGHDDDYENYYLSEWSEPVRVYNTVDTFAFTGGVTAVSWTDISIPFSYTTSRTGASSTPLFFTFEAFAIPDDGKIFEAGTVRRDGTPLAVANLKVKMSGDSSGGNAVGDPKNFALAAGDGTFVWDAAGDLGKAYYHTNVTIVVKGYEPAETEGGTPHLVVDKDIGGLTVDTRTPWFTPTANGLGIVLGWPAVEGAAKYEIYRNKTPGDEASDVKIAETAETTYTDSKFSDRYYTTQRYYYRIKPIAADGTALSSPDQFPAYCRLDFLNANSVHFSPRFPWSGQLDFRIQNFSARDKDSDGLPRFKLTATHAGNPIPVRTATLGDGTTIDPNDFTLVESDSAQTMEWTRLVWDARADLGETNLTSALDFKIEYIGLTKTDGKPYVGDTEIVKHGPAEGLDTRLVPEVALDGRTTYVYADTGWWNPAAGYVLVNIEGTQKLSMSGTGSCALTADILPIWGTNTLTITTDTGASWTGYVKYPDFAFTVSEGSADGVTLAWNDIPGVTDYAVRRRPFGSDAAFETIETVSNATTWTDTVENEVGGFEYTVMPLLPGGADAGPAPTAQRGYRTLEKVAFVAARSDEPWTPRVAVDIFYKSGRVAATDGAVTYRLERTDGGALTALTNDVGVAIDPANVALASGVTNRIWWSAAADLGAEAVASDLALRLVPTLATDAPEGAVAAPAALTCEPFAVDFRPTRDVAVGETVSVPWLWTRTDARDEAADTLVLKANLNGDWDWTNLCEIAVGAGPRAGVATVTVTDALWTSFKLEKHEKNGDTDETTTSFVTYRLPAEAPQNVSASRDVTNAVTVTWTAVPQAAGYKIVAEDCDAEGNRTTRPLTVSDGAATNYVDTEALAFGYTRYTVSAVYPNDAVGSASAAAIGWRSLDALTATVKTRTPWPSGKVDIDLAYVTARHALRANETGENVPASLPLTLAVRTADGTALTVATLTREPMFAERGYTLNRSGFTNGQELFNDTGATRLVWDAGADAAGTVAPGAVLSVSLGDRVVSETAFDLDARRQSRLPMTENMAAIPLRWAARWVDEGSTSLNMMDGHYVRLVEETADGTTRDLFNAHKRDVEGVVDWTPPTDVSDTVTVKAFYDDAEKADFTLTFFLAPEVNATARYQTDANAFHVTWDAVVDYDFAEVRYALLRRAVNRDGTKGAWTTVADALAATSYDDDSVGPDDLTVYEYAVRVRYSDGAGGWLDAAPSAGASAWAKAASLALSEPSLGAPWTATVGIDVEYATGQPVGGASDAVEVFAKDTVGNTNLTVRTLTLDGVDVVNGSFTLDKGATTSTGRLVWNAGADAPEANLANVVLVVKTVGSGLVKETAPFALDVRTRRDVAVGETIDIPWAWTRTDARDESADTLVLTANLNGDWDWTNLCEIAVGAGPRAGVATVTVTDDLWTSFMLEKHEKNGDTDVATTSFVTYRLPAEAPQGLTASQGDTNAVNLAWTAVPGATRYEIDAEVRDITQTTPDSTYTLKVDGNATTNITDVAAPALGYVFYTVTAVYPNGAKGAPTARVLGWRSLDALTVTVQTRAPWQDGKVDIDLAYRTARHDLASKGGPAAVAPVLALAVRTADGEPLTVTTFAANESEVGGGWSQSTVNRFFDFSNNSQIFSNDDVRRIVWDAGNDAANIGPTGVVLTVSLDGVVVDEVSFDLDTRSAAGPQPLAADAPALPLRWATRWVNEVTNSLSMMDGYDVRLDETVGGTTHTVFSAHKYNEEGVVDWTPQADAWGLITVQAFYDNAPKESHKLTFVRAPDVNVSATRNTGDGKIHVTWDAVPGAASYRVLRRTANRDGTAGDWSTLAERTTTDYEDTVGADDTTVYEYAVVVCYPNADDPNAPFAAAPSAAASGWSRTASLALSGLTVSDPWEADPVGVGVDFTYVTGQPLGTSDLATVVVEDLDCATNLTVQTLSVDGAAVANGAISLDKGVSASTGRLVWDAGADMPNVFLTNVVLRMKTAATGLEAMVGPFTLDTCGTRAVFDALGPWLAGGATVITQNVAAVYGTLPTATRAGCRLVGWFDGVTAGARQAVSGEGPLTRDGHRLYAKWETDWNGEVAFSYERIDESTARITGLTGVVPSGGLVLPDTIDGFLVTEIGEGAFANRLDAFGTVSLPLFCTSIGDYAFSGATGLTGLSFVTVRDGTNPQGAETLTIGESAFAGTGLSSMTIPAFVTAIDRWAFANCASLRTVTLLGAPVMGEDVFRRTPFAHGEGGASGGEGGDMPPGGEGSGTNETTVVDRVLRGTPGEESVVGAQTYRGYLYAESEGMAGTIDVKVARPQTRKGVTTARVTATIRLAGERALSLKGTFGFADEIAVSLAAKDGRLLSLTIDAAGLSGTFGAYEIDGGRDVFASRTAEDKALASAALAPWKGRPLALVWSGDSGWNALAVTVGAKGRVKVAGTLAGGTRVTASAQLIVGPDWCFAPVVVSKKNVSLAFGLWFAKDGSETAVEGLSADATLGEATNLDAGAAFRLDAAALCGLLGDAAYQDFLPDGLSVESRGSKWVVADGARAGKVVLDAAGAVDAAKAGANPSALKLTYRKKDGTFTGTFKAYRNVKGRPKAVTVKVTGLVLEGIGYGTATVGTLGSLPVTVE